MVKTNKTKLQELVGVPEKYKRKEALFRYARSLGVDPHKSINLDAEYCEEKLVLAIYDAEKIYLRNKKRDVTITLGGIGILLVMGLVLNFLPKIMRNAYNEESETQEKTAKNVYQGYDKNGKPMFDENKEPVLYGLMEGEYQQYYDDGSLKYEYSYKQGNLIRKKTYAPNGKLIEDKFYNP